MKNLFLLLICNLIVLVSCQPQKPDIKEIKSNEPKIEKESIIKGTIVSCKFQNNSNIDFEIYLPTSYEKDSLFPVIIFFDAHARGSLPLDKYKEIAEDYGFIMVGSDKSTNSKPWDFYQKIGKGILNQVINNYSIDTNRIFLSGFSGGARVASGLANEILEINGVIACAAGMGNPLPQITHSFNYVGIVGDEDFNYLEMFTLEENLKQSLINSQFYVFNGEHDWPPQETFKEAIKWMIGNDMKNGLVSKSDSFLQLIDTNTPWGKNILNEMKSEKELQGFYISSLGTKSIEWWKSEIDMIWKRIQNEDSKENSKIYQRVLNYLSLVCNLQANKALSSNDFEPAKYFLDLYQMVDPDNKDMFYLFSKYYTKINEPTLAAEYLKTAKKYGYEE